MNFCQQNAQWSWSQDSLGGGVLLPGEHGPAEVVVLPPAQPPVEGNPAMRADGTKRSGAGGRLAGILDELLATRTADPSRFAHWRIAHAGDADRNAERTIEWTDRRRTVITRAGRVLR